MTIIDDTLNQITGGNGVNWGGVSNFVVYSIFALVFFIIVGIVLFLALRKKKFNKKVVIFENLGGLGLRVTGKDRGMLIKLGDGGEEVLYLQKRKIYRNAYGQKMGDNEYWFVIGQDGYWYNITLENFDQKMKLLGVNPVDRDMRYMNIALRKNLEKRYQKEGFWEKYGALVMYFGLIIITAVMMYLLFDKYLDIAQSVDGSIKASKEVLDATREILGAVDNIQSGGSGLS